MISTFKLRAILLLVCLGHTDAFSGPSSQVSRVRKGSRGYASTRTRGVTVKVSSPAWAKSPESSTSTVLGSGGFDDAGPGIELVGGKLLVDGVPLLDRLSPCVYETRQASGDSDTGKPQRGIMLGVDFALAGSSDSPSARHDVILGHLKADKVCVGLSQRTSLHPR